MAHIHSWPETVVLLGQAIMCRICVRCYIHMYAWDEPLDLLALKEFNFLGGILPIFCAEAQFPVKIAP